MGQNSFTTGIRSHWYLFNFGCRRYICATIDTFKSQTLSVVHLFFLGYAPHRKVEILRVVDRLDTCAKVYDVASAVVLGSLVFAEINGRWLAWWLFFAWLLT